MTRKRVLLLLLVAAFLLLILFLVPFLPELGFLDDSNLYQSEVSTRRTGQLAFHHPTGTDRSVSYYLKIFYDSKPSPRATHQHTIQGRETPALEIDVDVIPSVSGNTWTPLYKSFTVEFSTSFESSTPDSQYRVEGDIDGSTQMTITGFCSQRKALELARDEIVENVKRYLVDVLR